MAARLALWMGTLLQVCRAAVHTNEWAIKIRGDPESVDRLAEEYGFSNLGQIGDLRSFYSFLHRGTANRSATANQGLTSAVAMETQVEWLQQQQVLRRTMRSSRSPPRLSTLQTPWPSASTLQQQLAAVWRRGYTGKGVVVSVLDDGVDREPPDLKPNYDPFASYHVNRPDQHSSSQLSSNAANHVGIQSAGTVAAAANDSACGVGVSFDARIGGIHVLDGDVTDVVEARALSFRPQYIHIYLAGWGPEDDGATVEGPGPLTRMVLQNGVQTGRRGRGSVFVWASGSGGRRGDHCSCDGYGGSIYTISISSSTAHGTPPPHLERCASTLAAAGGGEDAGEKVTLGQGRRCSRVSPGTFSASVAAGIIALALEANPGLTWRDVQHIIVQTSRPQHLLAPDWHANAAGHTVSHLYGFGLLDADAMVMEAEHWTPVPSQHKCVQEAAAQHSSTIRPDSPLTVVLRTSGCSGDAQRHVVYVEHVVARLSIAHCRRGDLSITLTSPSGTVSQLLANRPLDGSAHGFKDWEFMTTHCWGEPAAGEWTLKIHDTPSGKRGGSREGTLLRWSLLIYGTAEQPNPDPSDPDLNSDPNPSVPDPDLDPNPDLSDPDVNPKLSPHIKPGRRLKIRAVELEEEVTEEYSGPCDPECSADGCEGRSPQQCITCSHFFLKFKNNTRLCVSECPRGFWADRRRCKRCYSSCESCTGSRSDQCTSCQPGHHLIEGANTCTPSCGDGSYLDHDANMCRRCSENCLTCTSFSICTQCRADSSLHGNRCQRSCEAGFYHDTEDGSCTPCHKACATCAGAGVGSCQRCADGYLMEEWRCVSSCSAGFYATELNTELAARGGACRRCDASCLTCVGPGQVNCSSCSSGHSVQDGRCVVSSTCTDGEFQDADRKCQSCDETCQKCSGPQKQDCISCGSSRVLDEGRCVTACAEGKFESGGRCHLCDHTCASCVEGGVTNCTSCHTDKFGVERYLHAGRCLDACPEAFYHTAGHRCEPCSDHCRLCTSAGHCLRCQARYYASGGRCTKLECGEGEVEDPEYDDCMACQEGCRKCIPYNPRNCSSCSDGFYKFQDGCYKYCPAKTFPVESEMSCSPCDGACMSCDEHECYWCETDLFLLEGQCVSVCPDGFFADEDSNNCEECHPDCETCHGPEDDDCLSCEDSRALDSGECVSDLEACPVRTFGRDDGTCEDCHPSCQSCSGPEKNQCTQCAEGGLLTVQQTCVSQCPGGFFSDRRSGVCEACPADCLQCVDGGRCVRCLSSDRAPLLLQDGQCVQECVRGYPAGLVCRSCALGCASCGKNATDCLACDPPLLLLERRCVEACPPAHAAIDGGCRRCPAACRDCEPLGQCTGCEEDHFLHAGRCVLHCPQGFFQDEERGGCHRCHPDCASCDGPNADDCDGCADLDALLQGGACLPACGAQTYRDAVTGHCRACHASCQSCSGSDSASCLSCREDGRLDASGRCLPPPASHCSPHQYADGDGQCHACHKYCQRCWGPGRSQCLSCSATHLLLNGSCVDGCPAGFYQDGQRCDACHTSCQSCVGGRSHECLTCRAHLFREAKECVESCQPSRYGNAASGTCESCDPSCGECLGGGEDDCLSCAPGLLYLRREGRCLPFCPGGHYHNAAHRTCEPCHATCRTCSGGVSHSCDSCYPGFRLSEGRCESMCDVGQFPAAKGSGHSCEDCHSSCLECRGSGFSNCTMCPARAILEASGRCLLCCGGEEDEEEEEDRMKQQDCCNCTETQGECVLSTHRPFRIQEEEEDRGNLAIFIVACVLLALGLVAVVFLVRHSRSKSRPSDLPPRGYEKLGSGRHGGYSSASSAGYGGRAGSSFQEAQLVDLSERRRGIKDEDEDDEDDEDIVYMGQDGTVYRKFRYGQLGDDNEDELEYDDESYAFR